MSTLSVFVFLRARGGRELVERTVLLELARVYKLLQPGWTEYSTDGRIGQAGIDSGVHPKMGASFWLPLGSYTGMLSPLLWTTPNLGCTLTHGCGSKWGVSFRRPLGSHTDCGRDARVSRGDPQIWDAPVIEPNLDAIALPC